jgi:hypothetical protein
LSYISSILFCPAFGVRCTIQKSKFDKDIGKIKELLALGLSVRKIANYLGYSNHIGLNEYIKKRNIRNLHEAKA